MDDIKNMLDEEIKTELENLANLEPGSKEKETATNYLATLYKLKIEETRLENEYDMNLAKEELDEEFKKNESKERVKDRYFKVGLEAAGIVLPLIFYGTWMKRGLKFEETGTFTSQTFKGLFNRFKPTKK